MVENAFVTVGKWSVSYTSSTDYTGTKLNVFWLDSTKPFGQQVQYAVNGMHFDTDEMAQTFALCNGFIRLWERKAVA